jgi:predicted Zn-dependent peptidase
MAVNAHQFPNGMRLLVEELPHLQSVSLGIMVGVGSSLEHPKIQGISHFIEHLFFKGTAKRSAADIAQDMDRIGGQINAHTSKEFTMYFATCLEQHFDQSLDVLGDMLKNSQFRESDIETERKVILEEIKMYEDAPDDFVHDLAAETFWPNHPLGRPITGWHKTVSNITRQNILDFVKSFYAPDQITISVAGKVKTAVVKAKIQKIFGGLKTRGVPAFISKPISQAGVKVESRDIEQSHLCLTFPGLAYHDRDRYTLSVLSNILGSTMSSRLFQSVREKRGLVYSIYSYPSYFKDAGMFTIYAGQAHTSVPQVLDLTMLELKKLKKTKVLASDMQRAREQLKASMVLGLESSHSRMSYNAKAFFYFNRMITPTEIFKAIDKIQAADVLRLANQIFDPQAAQLTVLGQVSAKKIPGFKF